MKFNGSIQFDASRVDPELMERIQAAVRADLADQEWFALGLRREELAQVEREQYVTLGIALVEHLLASHGGPLVVSAYASPELEFIDWEHGPALEGDLSVIPGEEDS